MPPRRHRRQSPPNARESAHREGFFVFQSLRDNNEDLQALIAEERGRRIQPSIVADIDSVILQFNKDPDHQ